MARVNDIIYPDRGNSEVLTSGVGHVCEESWGLHSILCCSHFQTQQVAIHTLAHHSLHILYSTKRGSVISKK